MIATSFSTIIARVARISNKTTVRNLSSSCIVNSHNEFDPLEEVIVGRVEGSTIPEWHVSGKAVKHNILYI
jgi:hypothetical protein